MNYYEYNYSNVDSCVRQNLLVCGILKLTGSFKYIRLGAKLTKPKRWREFNYTHNHNLYLSHNLSHLVPKQNHV